MGAVVYWLIVGAGAVITGWLVVIVVREARSQHGHAPGVETPWFIPGNGGHGATGGQVPPFVPPLEKRDRIR
ncbi:MAG: hypothetical protein KY469_18040 [Actinobacteria bacterium]|nr:hypothetical protein [Actinomycetota bacterium]